MAGRRQDLIVQVEADPAYELQVFLLGGTTGYTTLVFEPYQNGVVTPGVWQQWDVDQGLFWSTRTVACPNGTVFGSPGGHQAANDQRVLVRGVRSRRRGIVGR